MSLIGQKCRFSVRRRVGKKNVKGLFRDTLVATIKTVQENKNYFIPSTELKFG